jgi:carbon monoxide dehydrogenase subunit G
MKPLTLTRTIQAPPEVVWSVITDLPGSADVIGAITAIEMLTEGPFGPGTTWRETRTMFGKAATEEMTVAAVDEGRSYVVTAESSGVAYRSTFEVAPHAQGSALTMTFSGEATSPVAKVMSTLMSPLMKGSMTKALTQDLDDIASAAEARS